MWPPVARWYQTQVTIVTICDHQVPTPNIPVTHYSNLLKFLQLPIPITPVTNISYSSYPLQLLQLPNPVTPVTHSSYSSYSCYPIQFLQFPI